MQPADEHRRPESNESPLPRLAVLASGSGTNLQALLDATASGQLAARVLLVVSDRPGAGALQRAEAAGVAAVALAPPDRRDPAARVAYDRRLAELVASCAPDLVVLAGWMLILSPAFLVRFPGRVVNVHPALLPVPGETSVASSAGPLLPLRGAHAVRDALRRGLPITGATVHWVTAEVDAGPAILRAEVPILAGDDELRLHERIKAAEHRLLPQAVALALESIAAQGQPTTPRDETADTGGIRNGASGDRSGLEVGSVAR